MVTLSIVQWEIITFIMGVTLTVLLLAVGHWYPWTRKLPRVQAYIYGTVSLLTGFTVWRGLTGDWVTVAGIWAIAGAGGLTVILAYRIDRFVLAERQAQMTKRGDDELGESTG